MSGAGFIEISDGFFADPEYVGVLQMLGLTGIDAVFDFQGGTSLHKDNMARHRSRMQIDVDDGRTVFFLKRYDRPSVTTQLANWLSHGKRAATSVFDFLPTEELAKVGINTPKTIAYGQQWDGCLERRSFIITEKIANAQSLEKKLPDFFQEAPSAENVRLRRAFIDQLADFARTFHETGFRHRDFYLAHMFLTDDNELYLIDLQRTFKPLVFAGRYRVKDIAQLYYSAPGPNFSRADRLRFYRRYTGRKKLTRSDRLFIKRVKAKAWRMADHDIKHGREVPFAM
jgi:heptose I phosphotransferase